VFGLEFGMSSWRFAVMNGRNKMAGARSAEITALLARPDFWVSGKRGSGLGDNDLELVGEGDERGVGARGAIGRDKAPLVVVERRLSIWTPFTVKVMMLFATVRSGRPRR